MQHTCEYVANLTWLSRKRLLKGQSENIICHIIYLSVIPFVIRSEVICIALFVIELFECRYVYRRVPICYSCVHAYKRCMPTFLVLVKKEVRCLLIEQNWHMTLTLSRRIKVKRKGFSLYLVFFSFVVSFLSVVFF